MLDKRIIKMSKKEEYIQKAKILHNNKYDYSLIEELTYPLKLMIQ